MRFLLRIVVFPFAIACIVLAAVIRLAAGMSGALLEALGGLCLICALFAWFIQGSGSDGLLLLGIARVLCGAGPAGPTPSPGA